MTRPNEIRLGPPDLSRTSNLHGSLLEGYLANGTAPRKGWAEEKGRWLQHIIVIYNIYYSFIIIITIIIIVIIIIIIGVFVFMVYVDTYTHWNSYSSALFFLFLLLIIVTSLFVFFIH